MITERDVAAEIAAWAEADGWDTFHEVTIPGGPRRVDLVCTRPHSLLPRVPVVMAIECKLQLSWALCAQAIRWKPQADYVYVAVPYSEPDEGRLLAFRTAEQFFKVGVLETGHTPAVRVAAPAPCLSRDDLLLNALRPEHKEWARGGSPGGGQYTPMQATLRNMSAFVKGIGPVGCRIEEVVDGITHHLRTRGGAIGLLHKMASDGDVPGVRVGWKRRLYPTEDA